MSHQKNSLKRVQLDQNSWHVHFCPPPTHSSSLFLSSFFFSLPFFFLSFFLLLGSLHLLALILTNSFRPGRSAILPIAEDNYKHKQKLLTHHHMYTFWRRVAQLVQWISCRKCRFPTSVGVYVLVTNGPGVVVTFHYAILSKGCSGAGRKETKMRRDK
jgi:hypothetical protein